MGPGLRRAHAPRSLQHRVSSETCLPVDKGQIPGVRLGMDRRPPCAHCGAPTNLMEGKPHSELPAGWQMLIFRCTACGRFTTRTKAPSGEPDQSDMP